MRRRRNETTTVAHAREPEPRRPLAQAEPKPGLVTSLFLGRKYSTPAECEVGAVKVSSGKLEK
jgi:hypothetical protein